MINLLLVDDHAIVRMGMRKLLNQVDGLHVVGEATNGSEAIECVSKGSIDVVLLDIQMPEMDGFEATRRLLNIDPQLKILVLSAFSQESSIYDLMRMGAKGYLSKTAPLEEVIKAIHEVSVGEFYLDASLVGRVSLKTMETKSVSSPFASLSECETEVAAFLIEGYTVGKIAKTIKRSVKTVSTYRSRLFEKLGVTDNLALFWLADQHDMLDNHLIMRNGETDSSQKA